MLPPDSERDTSIRRLVLKGVAFLTVGFLVPLITDGALHTYPSYPWTRVRSRTLTLANSLQMLDDNARQKHEPVIDVAEIDRYLSGDDDVHRELHFVPRWTDAWGNPYKTKRVIDQDTGQLVVGAYSLGEDGRSHSGGSDSDDLNSWDTDCCRYYIRRAARRRLVVRFLVGIFWAIGLAVMYHLFFASPDNQHRVRRPRSG